MLNLFFFCGCCGVAWLLIASEFYRNVKWSGGRLLRLILIFVLTVLYSLMAEVAKNLILGWFY